MSGVGGQGGASGRTISGTYDVVDFGSSEALAADTRSSVAAQGLETAGLAATIVARQPSSSLPVGLLRPLLTASHCIALGDDD